MSSASHQGDSGSNPGKGQFFRIKMKTSNIQHLWKGLAAGCHSKNNLLNYYAVVTLKYYSNLVERLSQFPLVNS